MEIFRNSEWVVEWAYLRHTGPVDYVIDLGRIFETTERERLYYDWPLQIAEKNGWKIGLFIDAFKHALDHQSELSGEPIDQEMLEATIEKAFLIARR